MLTTKKLMISLALSAFLASADDSRAIYVVTGAQQFGVVDLETGSFRPIGSGTPEPDSNLVRGPHGTLYSLAVLSGSLVSINPATGATTVIGPTGLGSFAFSLAEVQGKLYLTDFSNNLYSVNPATGAATLIGPTGMPPDPHMPFTFNPDGTFNLCDEILYGVGDKLFATFDAFTLDPHNLAMNFLVEPNLWQIDPSTGIATLIAPTTQNLGAGVVSDGAFYAIRLHPVGFTALGPLTVSELDALNLANGNTAFLHRIARSAGPIFGAAPVRATLD